MHTKVWVVSLWATLWLPNKIKKWLKIKRLTVVCGAHNRTTLSTFNCSLIPLYCY